MCGIFGFSRLTDVTRRMAPLLAMEMESRGKDSWGATAGGPDVFKHLGPITKSWHTFASSQEFLSTWPRAIFHTRAASTGAVTLENQHPFQIECKGVTYIGIHNGIITNHEELNKKHKRSFECDSPHIFMAIAGFSPPREICGYGNIAWYTRKPNENPELHLLRFNGDNLNVARLTSGEIVFCSNKDCITKAANMAGSDIKNFCTIDPEHQYNIGVGTSEDGVSDEVYTGVKVDFGYRYLSTIHNVSNTDSWSDSFWGGREGRRNTIFSSSGNQDHRRIGMLGPVVSKDPSAVGRADRSNNICLMNGCLNKVRGSRTRSIVCDTHYNEIARELGEIIVDSEVTA